MLYFLPSQKFSLDLRYPPASILFLSFSLKQKFFQEWPREFPDDLVVRTPYFHCHEFVFSPGEGTKIQAEKQKKKKKKRERERENERQLPLFY